ncbi:hypothetical protein [Bdellovibrio sp. HCB337]|uniref:hypothetical protein n=1 Tax=Bdellovibrio sp. HCB337 TaxID=3394358 RepID=UPI0039A515DF
MKTILLLSLLFSFNCFALTKNEALVLSKSRIEGLKLGFRALAYNCFTAEEDCQIETYSQSATLKWILSEQPAPSVEYSSGPENFTIDGAVRIAKTGSTWGSLVIFNEDLLTREVTPGNFEALEFFEIIGVLVHEFGHHQAEWLDKAGLPQLGHQELDELAVKVVTYLKDRTRQIRITQDEVPELKPGHELTIYQIDIEYFNGIRNIWSNIFIDSIVETREISQILLHGVACPKSYTRGHLTFDGKPNYISLRKVKAPKFEFKNSLITMKQDAEEGSVLCIDSQQGTFNVFRGYTDIHLRLQFRLNDQGNLDFAENGTYLNAVPPPDEHAQ